MALTIQHSEELPTMSSRQKARNWLDLKVAEYQAKQGKIEQVPYGIRTDYIGNYGMNAEDRERLRQSALSGAKTTAKKATEPPQA